MATGVQIVSSLVDEWNAHDLDAVYAHLSDDYREYINGTLAKRGPAQARAADADLYEMIPDYRRTVDEIWGSDDRVVSRFVIHGTMTGGGRFQLAVACVYGIRDELISEAHLYFDPATAVAAT